MLMLRLAVLARASLASVRMAVETSVATTVVVVVTVAAVAMVDAGRLPVLHMVLTLRSKRGVWSN